MNMLNTYPAIILPQIAFSLSYSIQLFTHSANFCRMRLWRQHYRRMYTYEDIFQDHFPHVNQFYPDSGYHAGSLYLE